MNGDLARVVEENQIAFLMALGRAGGAAERQDATVEWTIGGSPIGYHNAVVRASLTSDDVDREIAASVEAFRSHGAAGSWHVGPSMSPPELGTRLVAHGFTPAPEPGMTCDLATLPDLPSVDGLRIDRVSAADGLRDYERVLGSGFGEGPSEAAWVCEMYERIGLHDDTNWRHFVARLDGEPVATASTFFTVDSAGLYFVSTSPDHRRKGIGASISHHAMSDAHDLGWQTGVLGSSPMGQRVYERLGFREVCQVVVYETMSA